MRLQGLSALIACLLYTAGAAETQRVYYCPENGETATVDLTTPAQVRTVFAASDTYQSNQNCKWILDAGPDPYNRLQVFVNQSDIQWTPPDVDCSMYDYIELRDGKSLTGDLVKKWCGSVITTVISPGNALFVSFESDSIHLLEKKGVILDINAFSVDPTTGTCPSGWIPDSGPTGSCYRIRMRAETWKDAQDFCRNDQANLISISGSTQETFVLSQAKLAANQNSGEFDKFWIGLNDIVKEGQYVWVAEDDHNISPFSTSKLPTNPELYKDCVMVDMNTAVWTEDHCHRPEVRSTAKHPYICERKKDGTTKPQASPPVEAVTYYCKPDGKILYISSAETARIQTRVEGTATYGKNLACRWIINSGSDPDMRIHIKVTKSDLQWTPADAICYGYDIVDVKDGPNYNSDTLSTFCGTMNPFTLTSSSNALYITFRSNDRTIYNRVGATLDFSFFSVAPGLDECPPDWFSDSVNGKYCYNIRTHAESWLAAQQFCNNDQANLASLEDEVEEKFVTDYAIQTLLPLHFNQFWIGLNDISTEGQFVWLGGKSADSFKSRFSTSEYSSSLFEDCVVVGLQTRRWKEEFCTNAEVQTTDKYPFVCKRKRDGSTPIYPIPKGTSDKEGKKKSLPPKGAIIAGTIFALLVVIGLGVAAVYYKKSQCLISGRNNHSGSPVPTVYLQDTTNTRTHPASHAASTDGCQDLPPDYDEVFHMTKPGLQPGRYRPLVGVLRF